MRIAFSPCPNDTFLFYGWVHRRIDQLPPPRVKLADIDQLNRWALQGQFDLLKVSCGLLDKIRDRYRLLPVGAALGWDCGPKLVARHFFPPELLAEKRVAIPGEQTTAHLLLQLFFPSPAEKRFCLYHQMRQLLDQGAVDAALIIHEHRFCFEKWGFVEIADLGALWTERYHLPVPLGCLVMRRGLQDQEAAVVAALGGSLDYAHGHFDEAWDYVVRWSQEKDPSIVRRHIETYVNRETAALSEIGYRAIETLLMEKESHNVCHL
jgi:1,4-dihydroxy-6-naphthoate synthase